MGFWTVNNHFSDEWAVGPMTHLFRPIVFGPITRFLTIDGPSESDYRHGNAMTVTGHAICCVAEGNENGKSSFAANKVIWFTNSCVACSINMYIILHVMLYIQFNLYCTVYI